MNKLGWIGLVLSLGGCFGGDLDLDFGPDLGLQDAWTPAGLESRYMLGSVFPIEIVRPERPLDEYEVVSRDPEVLRITNGAGFEAEALSIGATMVELRADDEVVRSYRVSVTVPDEIELMIEREDSIGGDLTHARTPTGDELAILAGESVDIHVRYYEEGQRVYGGSVASVDTELPATVPEWSPQGNVIRIAPETAGAFDAVFRVGTLERTVDIHVADSAASLELVEGEGDDLIILVRPDGSIAGDQVIRPDARDAEGRLLQGTLPIVWTMELGSETISLGEGTLLGVLGDGSENAVTATLSGLSATYIARGVETFVAP